MQQQITIAATLLSITPHNTPASCAGAFAEQTPLLPPTFRRAALSDAPARTAFLFALLNAHHVAQHVVKIAAQRHLRGDHLPRRDFRARFRARTPRATPRHLCLLRPARQQTARNISGSLLIIQHHLPSCSATACGTSEWTIFPGTTSARDLFQVRVPRLAPRAPCLLRPARQQTIYNINGLLTSLSTTPFTVFGICPAGSRAPGASAALALSAVPAGAVRHENTRNSRPLRLVNHRRRPCATITRLHCHV